MINLKTGQFVPAAQYFLQTFDASHYTYFNAKPKKLEDKSIPDTFVCLKISKHHIETGEMKDRLVKESLQQLTHYVASNANCISLPESMIPVSYTLRKFKKNVKNQVYRKAVISFLDLLQQTTDKVAEERVKVLDSISVQEPGLITQKFSELLSLSQLPIVKESEKLLHRHMEQLTRKIKI